MTRSFFRSLDRELDLVGLKGRWVTVFLYLLGGSLLLAIFVGAVGGMSFGLAGFMIAAVGSFLFCLTRQGSVSSRQLGKARVEGRMESAVIRRETISRILAPRDLSSPGTGDVPAE